MCCESGGSLPVEHWLGPVTCVMEWAGDGQAWLCQWGATDFAGDAYHATSDWMRDGGWLWTGRTWDELWDDTPVAVWLLLKRDGPGTIVASDHTH